MDLLEDAIAWEASFTITIDNHFLLLEASDVVVAPYRVMKFLTGLIRIQLSDLRPVGYEP